MAQEGVIKFKLDFTLENPLPEDRLKEITAWRKLLFMLRLIGQDPARYGGFGFGNISNRIAPWDSPPNQRRFIISGTQTGGLPDLGPRHYTLVRECHWQENRVVAEGPVPPSSESLTHGTLYAMDDSIRFVIHVHSPEIWRNAGQLQIPVSAPEVAYGTPEMAEEILRILGDPIPRSKGILAMGGHEDGVVTFGRTAAEAGTCLIRYLALAYQATA
ncbi:hypothetical protein DESUT3_20570 [Desulfuromonas versatilis]|uniref:Class II aldolase/adducin N-terminal domain-containing protein n=1 Tax=Desulfuromonas versatilis TaxID=2802975 RepID=A0ABN6DXY3_9BACT|nr:class II aldolase/adducin family protein [Desulfuromonas versatilis]BCR04988.1 hypothetical protein DESUT3_20570 [Desulfuromonas versatilis]